ncbi:hypothetical protein K402DRAFT_94545 [Aulographum hederae CBS 113979]|uniref:Uncharacterized protein n=1 Tax=Aulographum hederae CBS 113979 TaxID=1176131 RepID=A0A6G1GY68_9PEZI|nr:hypothetical protein K402DRAFT_94545 [Aulographum hederae CBS 113979]
MNPTGLQTRFELFAILVAYPATSFSKMEPTTYTQDQTSSSSRPSSSPILDKMELAAQPQDQTSKDRDAKARLARAAKRRRAAHIWLASILVSLAFYTFGEFSFIRSHALACSFVCLSSYVMTWYFASLDRRRVYGLSESRVPLVCYIVCMVVTAVFLRSVHAWFAREVGGLEVREGWPLCVSYAWLLGRC